MSWQLVYQSVLFYLCCHFVTISIFTSALIKSPIGLHFIHKISLKQMYVCMHACMHVYAYENSLKGRNCHSCNLNLARTLAKVGLKTSVCSVTLSQLSQLPSQFSQLSLCQVSYLKIAASANQYQSGLNCQQMINHN